MGAPEDGGGDLKLHAGLLGQDEGPGDAGVVGGHVQQSGHQGPVGAVALAGGGKGAVEEKLGGDGLAAQQMTGDEPDPYRPRGVGGRRPHHNGAHNVENIHGDAPYLR